VFHQQSIARVLLFRYRSASHQILLMPIRKPQRHLAVIGAGLAGITCARTLLQAGHHVQLFEKSRGFGGRMASRNSTFGSFDHGAQFFTVRDARFMNMLAELPGVCKAWNETVRTFDSQGHFSQLASSNKETHWMSIPRMNALPQQMAQPLLDLGLVNLQTRVAQISQQGSNGWQLHLEGQNGTKYTKSGFDGVLLAMPAPQTQQLLESAGPVVALKSWVSLLGSVEMAPCWTLMVSFGRQFNSMRVPALNAARSSSHSIAWLARESSKPERGQVERWILQASHAWSYNNFETDQLEVQKRLLQAFFEVTGNISEPTHVDSHRWRWAQTVTPLGQSHLWQSELDIGVCGDWCLGHRLESAFISGLELAQAVS
jgi:predicted NAD/FAD-dependent oxidoreductase